MASPRQAPSPVLTPSAFHGGRVPWVLETPTPSMMNMQKTNSDPFMLRATLSTPKQPFAPAWGVQASLATAAGAADAGAAEEVEPVEAPAMPRIPRQVLREVCRPFFEKMVQAVEEALLGADADSANGEAPWDTAYEEHLQEEDAVRRQASTNLEDYPFFGDLRSLDAVHAEEPSPTGSGASYEHGASEPSGNDAVSAPCAAQCPTASDLAAPPCFMSSGLADLAQPELKRDQSTVSSTSAGIPSSVSSSSIGIPSSGSIPTCVSSSSVGAWSAPGSESRYGEAAAAGARTVESLGSLELASSHSAMLPEGALKAEGKAGGSSRGEPRTSKRSKDVGTKISIHASTGSKGMVCRHWQSKGFCKYENRCKFAHPEHKRGAGMSETPAGGSAQQRPSFSAQPLAQPQVGQMLTVAGGYNMPCMAFLPPAMHHVVAQPGCIYPFAAHSPQP